MIKFSKFVKKYNWVLILILALFFIPQSFSYQAKINERVLVTGLAIDKAKEGYEITAQIVLPSPGSQSEGSGAKLDFISEKGESVLVGLQKIAYKIGKIAGLSHTNFIIIGENMSDENIVSVLDYFARDSQITPSLLLLFCDGSAKEMIKQTQNLELSVGVGLQKVFINKESSLNGIMMTIEQFVNGAYGLSKSSTASGILIAPEGEEKLGETTSSTTKGNSNQQEQSGQSQSGLNQDSKQSSSNNSEESKSNSSDSGDSGSDSQSSNSSSGSSSNGGSEQKARIKYYNDIYYFKSGEYIGKIDTEQEILGYLMADKHKSNGQFFVKGVSGAGLKDAIIGGKVANKKTNTYVKFKEGKPVLVFEINIRNVIIEEILNQSNINVDLYNFKNKEIFKLTEIAIGESIKGSIEQVFEKTKGENVDIFDIAERAYQTKPRKWKNFYKEYGENYLKECEIEVKVNIRNVN